MKKLLETTMVGEIEKPARSHGLDENARVVNKSGLSDEVLSTDYRMEFSGTTHNRSNGLTAFLFQPDGCRIIT